MIPITHMVQKPDLLLISMAKQTKGKSKYKCLIVFFLQETCKSSKLDKVEEKHGNKIINILVIVV